MGSYCQAIVPSRLRMQNNLVLILLRKFTIKDLYKLMFNILNNF